MTSIPQITRMIARIEMERVTREGARPRGDRSRARALAAIALAGLLIASVGRVAAQAPTEPNNTMAIFFSGEEMLNYCKDANHREGCTGFAMGVADAAAEASAAGIIVRPFRVCRSAEITGSQTLDVLLQFLQAHPSELHYSAASLAIPALSAAWPCP